MSGKFVLPVAVEPAGSLTLAIGMVAIHAAAVPAIVFSGVDILPACFFLLLTGYSLVSGWRLQISRRHPQAVLRLVLHDDGSCELLLANGEHIRSRLNGSFCLFRHVVVLGLEPRERFRRRHLAVFRDAISADRFRQFRVCVLTRPDNHAIS